MSQVSDRLRRYRDLVERFTALDPHDPEFASDFTLLKGSAIATLNTNNAVGSAGRIENLKIARTFAAEKRRRDQKLIREKYLPHIEQLRAEGKITLRDIALGLNEKGIKPPLAELWSHGMVRGLLIRAGRYQ